MTSHQPTIQTSIKLPVSLKEKIDAHTEKTGVPMAAMIRIGLAVYLESQKEKEVA